MYYNEAVTPGTRTGISLWKLPAGTIRQLQRKTENQSHHSVALMALKCGSLFPCQASQPMSSSRVCVLDITT